jgi:Ca2+-transporting ATPase
MPVEPAAFGLELLGLAALADPLRPDIPAAVAACRGAGLRVVMITGDHPETARAIARQAGLDAGAPDAVLTGAALATLDDAGLARRLAATDVCARVAPQQKLRVVRALQQGGAVVAMTGDGVNDAPALRAADVGVAMGRRGTDVAREAAELTLLDDRFASLVEAIATGRRIFGNMRKSMCYVMAMHVPIAGMALLPVLLGWPVMLYPLHIVFLELVIDPACSLAFENEPAEADLMRRPPRAPGEALFGRAAVGSALVQGAWVLALLVALYAWALMAAGTGGTQRRVCRAGAVQPRTAAVEPPARRCREHAAGRQPGVLGDRRGGAAAARAGDVCAGAGRHPRPCAAAARRAGRRPRDGAAGAGRAGAAQVDGGVDPG